MPSPPIQIFTAIELEQRAIERALRNLPASTTPLDYQITTIGVRATRCPMSLDDSIRLVVLMGLAGGLDPTLKVGDLVIDCGADLLRSLTTAARSGKIVTAPVPVCTPADKTELRRRTGAIAVEMEGEIVAKLAASAGVPFVHLRAVSDAADTLLDPQLLSLVDDIGRPRPWRIAGYLAGDPRRIVSLQRLGRDTRLALERLGQEMTRLLPQFSLLEPGAPASR